MSTLPTLYEYYATPTITAGLSTTQPYFTLNEKNITLYSGAMHYFRVPPEYWRDRLRKMKAAGLNTVETYVPWNLHEPEPGNFDFGNGTSDFRDFLDLEKFLKIAQEEDLLAIVRPGPYICAEWEFGGLPSWLLREENIKVRTSDPKYMKHVNRFFGALLPILAALQFINGGPIVGFQIENEYGSTKTKNFVPDKEYLRQLKQLMLANNITELLFTSDSPLQNADSGTLPGLFQTANFQTGATKEFEKLKTLQNNTPTMSMEYWTGWFDHWSEKHHTRSNQNFYNVLEEILKYPASVNMYMFHGGTNWGFLNGANSKLEEGTYMPTVTSYDYDAPLSENGNYGGKYFLTKALLDKHNKILLKVPPRPHETPSLTYPSVQVESQIQYEGIINTLPTFRSEKVKSMELLPINNNAGQSYGYTVYRTKVDIAANSTLKLRGYLHDSVLVLVNGQLISEPLRNASDLDGFGYWRLKDGTISVPEATNATLDIVAINWGRVNFGKLEQFVQFKGLTDSVFLNDKELFNWEIMPLEFKKKWTTSLTGWRTFQKTNVTISKFKLVVDDPTDSFLDMRKWNTGIVVVNGFVLGRYVILGPQRTLYLPAPLLHKGDNEILVFEYFEAFDTLSFAQEHIYS